MTKLMVGETLARVLDELRAIRNEQRRLAENQMLINQAIRSLRDDLWEQNMSPKWWQISAE
jgi:hypothetical protein